MPNITLWYIWKTKLNKVDNIVANAIEMSNCENDSNKNNN